MNGFNKIHTLCYPQTVCLDVLNGTVNICEIMNNKDI